MDSLYELLCQVSELAPEECWLEDDGIRFFSSPNNIDLFLDKDDLETNQDLYWAHLLRPVCYQLEKRGIDFYVQSGAHDGYDAAVIFNSIPGQHGSTPAHALLGAYVEYLKAEQ